MMVDSLQSLFDTVEIQFDPMTYKTQPCPSPNCSEELCSFYHSDSDRRRNVNEHRYDCKPCKWVYTGDSWKAPTECKFRDECRFAHCVYEVRYHPKTYKTQLCTNPHCSLGLMCWNKHDNTPAESPICVTEEAEMTTPLDELLVEKEQKSARLANELMDTTARLSSLELALEEATRIASCFQCCARPISQALVPCGHVLCSECVDCGRDKCPACNSIVIIALELKLGL